MNDVIIIGAGIAGLSAARELSKAGLDVLVLEKSRGLGGRSATRRLESNRVDHGAQYFTARDDRFKKQINDWLECSKLKVWSHGFHVLTEEGLQGPTKGHPRYVFPEGMNTIGKLLAEGLKIENQTKAKTLSKKNNIWHVQSEAGQSFQARAVIVNTPAEQALGLLSFAAPALKAALSSVVMEPSFALMLGYPKELAPVWHGILLRTPSPLSWIAHDSSKRTDPLNTVLTLHSTAAFARSYFNDDPEQVQTILLAALLASDKSFANPLFSSFQRWKYALASTSIKEKFLHHDDVYICGDWCGGAKIEAAYLSGLATAEALTQA